MSYLQKAGGMEVQCFDGHHIKADRKRTRPKCSSCSAIHEDFRALLGAVRVYAYIYLVVEFVGEFLANRIQIALRSSEGFTDNDCGSFEDLPRMNTQYQMNGKLAKKGDTLYIWNSVWRASY